MPKPLSYRIRAELFTQLGHMEGAGVPTDRAFSILALDRSARSRIEAARELLKRYDPAVAGERSGLFTKLEARLIKVALTSGSPAAMYQRFAAVYTQRAMQSSSIKSKLVLPGFMLLAALFISPIVGLLTGTMSVSSYVWQVVKPLLFIGALFFGLRLFLTSSSNMRLLPVIGSMIEWRNSRDFFEGLALMLEAGLPMLDALPLAIETIEESDIRKDYAKLRPKIVNGAPLSNALEGLKFLGTAANREQAISFTRTGETSGTLPEMLFRHVEMETEDINHTQAQITAWIPKAVYLCVAIWMAYSILTGPGLMSAPMSL